MQSPWMFINYLTIAQNNHKLSDNIANTANLTNNGLTNDLTRLTLAATGIDLLARRGISLADIRPTKVSVSRTSKWLTLQALETFFGFFHDVPPFKLFGFMSVAETHHDGCQRPKLLAIQSSHYRPRRALTYTMFSKCLSSVLLRWQHDNPQSLPSVTALRNSQRTELSAEMNLSSGGINRVILQGRMPQLRQRDLKSMIPRWHRPTPRRCKCKSCRCDSDDYPVKSRTWFFQHRFPSRDSRRTPFQKMPCQTTMSDFFISKTLYWHIAQSGRAHGC